MVSLRRRRQHMTPNPARRFRRALRRGRTPLLWLVLGLVLFGSAGVQPAGAQQPAPELPPVTLPGGGGEVIQGPWPGSGGTPAPTRPNTGGGAGNPISWILEEIDNMHCEEGTCHREATGPVPGTIVTTGGTATGVEWVGSYSGTDLWDPLPITLDHFGPTAAWMSAMRIKVDPDSEGRWIVVHSTEQWGNTVSVAVRDDGPVGVPGQGRLWKVAFRYGGASHEETVGAAEDENGWGTSVLLVHQYQNGAEDVVAGQFFSQPDPETGEAAGYGWEDMGLGNRGWTPVREATGEYEGDAYVGAGPLETWGGPEGDAEIELWNVTHDGYYMDGGYDSNFSALVGSLYSADEPEVDVEPYDWHGIFPWPGVPPDGATEPEPVPEVEPTPDPVPEPTPDTLPEADPEVDAGSSWLGSVFETVINGLRDAIKGLFDWLGNLLRDMFGWVVDTIWAAAIFVKEFVFHVRVLMDHLLRSLFRQLGGVVEWVGHRVMRGARLIVQALKDVATWFWDELLGPVFDWLAETVIGPAFGWLAQAFRDALEDVVNGIGALLRMLFVPQNSIMLDFPPELEAIQNEVNEVGAVLPDATVSTCGPVIEDEVIGQDVWFAFPSWDGGCPGNGPGRSRTEMDDFAGSLGGYRLPIRVVFGLAVFVAILWRFYSFLPWVDDHDYEKNPVQLHMSLDGV